ncbi:MAG: CDP-diacylglycerol--glycerol-3-phosphate 3-phosphatidyltransferase, partial [Pseudomonadota bacterium]
ITALLAVGLFEHYLGMRSYGMDRALVRDILNGTIDDTQGLKGLYLGLQVTWYGGIVLLWAAGILTVITGYDYLQKAWKYLQG